MLQRSKRGHSLVELVIAMAVLVGVIGLPAMILSSSSRSFGASTSTTELDLAARRALDRIAERLASSGTAGIIDPLNPVPGVPLTALTFMPLVDLTAAGEPVWGPQERIELQMAPGEVLNGSDDNGDGLVDEGRLVWFPDLSVPTSAVVLCTGVRAALPGEVLGNGNDDNGNGLIDERGFVLRFEGGRVELILVLERRGNEGRMYQQVATRSVALRN